MNHAFSPRLSSWITSIADAGLHLFPIRIRMEPLWKRLEAERARKREALRHDVGLRLRQSMARFAPGIPYIVFGSLTRPGKFHARSDVDVALFAEPRDSGSLGLQAELEEALERPVDLVVLTSCRFRDKVLREGEEWTNSV